MNRILHAAPFLLLAAACARTEDPSEVQVDINQSASPAPRVAANPQADREPAIGEWRDSSQDGARALEFGPIGTQPLLSLLCTGRQSVLLQRHGGVPPGPLPQLRLMIGDQDVRVPVTPGGGAIPMLRADLPLNHPVVQALARGGQTLTMRLGDDGTPFNIPESPRVGDYLRSCATATPAQGVVGGPLTTNSAADNSAIGNAAATAPGNAAAPANAANSVGTGR